MTSAITFGERRRRVMDAIGHGAAMVLAAAPELRVGRDAEFRYAVDPDLWYLTGYTEPEAVLVLRPAETEPAYTLFVRPRDRKKETWTGVRGGTEAARDAFHADAAFPIEELSDRLPKLLAEVDTVYARLESGRPDVDALVRAAVVNARHSRPRTGKGPFVLIEPGSVLNEMRLYKDAAEIGAIRDAAGVSIEAFRAAARRIRPGAGEWELEAAIDHEFRARGADGAAFPTIVASGANATVLHHVRNDRVMAAGELVLLDAGARMHMYAADITRTFPVSGRFDGERAALYDLVLAAHDAAIDVARPGSTIQRIHETAQRILVDGLMSLGLLEGDLDELLKEGGGASRYYPHRTSHWLGLDVHDVGDYVSPAGPRALEPGMVLTIEPGLYLPADDESVPEAWRGIGVRIEDDVLITLEGHEVLTSALPVRPAEIAALAG
jgi:Xaa-Pro aminopeptidase